MACQGHITSNITFLRGKKQTLKIRKLSLKMITYQIVGQINKEMACEQLEKEVDLLRMRHFLLTSFPFLI